MHGWFLVLFEKFSREGGRESGSRHRGSSNIVTTSTPRHLQTRLLPTLRMMFIIGTEKIIGWSGCMSLISLSKCCGSSVLRGSIRGLSLLKDYTNRDVT